LRGRPLDIPQFGSWAAALLWLAGHHFDVASSFS
jgi:hypothetical protein